MMNFKSSYLETFYKLMDGKSEKSKNLARYGNRVKVATIDNVFVGHICGMDQDNIFLNLKEDNTAIMNIPLENIWTIIPFFY